MKTALLRASVALLLSSTAQAAPELFRGIPEGGDVLYTPHTTLDLAATYGIGGYSALGFQLHAKEQFSNWNTSVATGSFDLGLALGWQDEPQSLQFAQPKGQKNDAQRLNLWATLGHTFHMGRERRANLGFHLFGGWTHVWSTASLKMPDLGVDRASADNYGLWNAGAMLKFDYRLSRYVGFNLEATAPFYPMGMSYVRTLFHVGAGLTVYLL